MLDTALKILKEITSHSYQAYIVGGFVRDHLLGIESNDIDICTNATPKEIKEIFEDSCLPNEDYGSVVVLKKGIQFEITTFRREIEYVDHRKPLQIKYIEDLRQDLLRRDFVINTICMDENGEIIDYLNGRDDLNNKVIRTVGSAYDKFVEDSLRILRAVRFATILDFSLDDEIVEAIKSTKIYLKDLSYQRKREELDKIFTSSNYRKGIQLLLDLELEKVLEIPKLSLVLNTDTSSLIGIWSILDVTDKYPFNKNELDLINDIKDVTKMNNTDPMTLYEYGLYVNSVAGEIKRDDIRLITEAYNDLVIKGRNEINIDSDSIMKLLHKSPGKYLKDVYGDIEREILYKRLDNDYDSIQNYILDKYQ